MAYASIDFTEAWVVDYESVLTVTAPKIAGAAVDVRLDNAWAMYDLGSGNEIGGSGGGTAIRARCEFTMTSWSAFNYLGLMMFTTAPDAMRAFQDNPSLAEMIVVRMEADGSSNKYLKIEDVTNGTRTVTSGAVALSLSTKYYVSVEFDPALGTNGRITASIYTGSHGGTLVETVTRDLAGAQDAWRYFMPYSAGYVANTGTTITGTFDVENMEIENFSVSDSTALAQSINHQDYGDSTEVDPNSVLSVTTTQITGTNVSIDDDSYLHKTLSSAVNADWTGYCKINVTIVDQFHLGFFASLLETTAGTPADLNGAGTEDGLFLGIQAPTANTAYTLAIREMVNGAYTFFGVGTGGGTALKEGRDYYIQMSYDRDGGSGTGQVVVRAVEGHPAAIRAFDTLTRNLTAQNDYSILQNFTCDDSGGVTRDANFVIRDSYYSFDENPDILVSVETDVALSVTGVFETNDTIDSDAIKRDIGGKSIARDGGTSRIWVLGVDTTAGETVALYTPSDGISWVSETITNGFAARAHALCIGAGGEPVVALHKESTTDIQIWQRASGVWTKTATVSAGSASDIDSFGIHYDGTTYHLIYMDQGSTSVAAASRNRLRYRTSTNLTSWSSATDVDAGHANGPYGNSKAMVSAIDRSGDLHVIYGKGTSTGDQLLWYAKYDGSWTTEQIADFGVSFVNNNRLRSMDMAIDSNDKPHFVGIIEADAVLGASNGFVDDDDFAAFYWNKTGSSWSSPTTLDAVDSTVQGNYNPTIHFNNGTTAIIHWGSQTTSGAELKRLEGSSRTRVGLVDQFGTNAQNFDLDAAHYARTNGGYLVTGDFLYMRGSLIMIQSVATVWGDGTTLLESVPTFSHVIQVFGRPKPETDIELSQEITLNFAYATGRTSDIAMSDQNALKMAFARGDTDAPPFSQDIGYVYVPTGGGGNTIFVAVTENRLNFSNEVRYLVQTEVSHDLAFSQNINLTLGKTIPQDIELSQDLTVQKIKLLTASGDVLVSDVVFMNKELNLGVSHDLVFSQNGLPIRDWNAYSTHFNPGWGFEDDHLQVVFLHPASLPTTSVTFMRPDFGDERIDHRRDGAVRRNRSGQARTFKTPVYSKFVLNWTGIPRFVAEEFRTRMISYFGDILKYQDHNGVVHEVIISDTALTRSSIGPENMNVSITLEKVNRVDLSPTTVG